MKYITVFIILLQTSLFGIEFSFNDLRSQERILVLKEFKRLYYKRKNIHQNMSQVLKNARSKSLQKNQISFFQAKSKYKDEHPGELSNVYLQISTPCEQDCQVLQTGANDEMEIPDLIGDNDNEIDRPINIIDSDTAIDEKVKTTNIREFAVNPWAKR